LSFDERNARTLSSLLEYADLKELGLDNYTGPDLRPFAKLSSLENIGMAYTRLESLAGVERFPNLRRLSLERDNGVERKETKSEGFCFQSERLLYGRDRNGVREELGKQKPRICRMQELA